MAQAGLPLGVTTPPHQLPLYHQLLLSYLHAFVPLPRGGRAHPAASPTATSAASAAASLATSPASLSAAAAAAAVPATAATVAHAAAALLAQDAVHAV